MVIKGRKVLVTGGAGFIGSNLCEELVKNQNEVICLDNFSTGHRENLAPLMNHENFSLIEGDLRDYSVCEKAVDGCDYVLHQAALGSVPRSINDPMTSVEVNISGFVNILHAAAKANVKRFVYAASSSTYGTHKALPKVEHVIGEAMSPYAITKYVNELFAKNFSEIYDIETIGLRYFNVFGRKQDPDGAYAAVIPKFVKTLMKLESPTINGDGSYSRDFTYIDNVIQANQLAAITPKETILENRKVYNEKHGIADEQNVNSLNEVFNVAFGGRTSLVELVEYLKESLGEFNRDIKNVEVNFGPVRAGDVPHSQASIDKARDLIGYNPKYSVEDGIKLATKWYWENL